MGYPAYQRARAFKFLKRTSGNFTVTSATWADLNTATDLVLEGQVGDVIEASVNAEWGSEGFTGALDVCTIVSATPVNYFGGDGGGTSMGAVGWAGPASAFTFLGGSIFYTLQSADVSSGQVTLRLRARLTNAGTKTLYAVTSDPFQWAVKNLGPMDPH